MAADVGRGFLIFLFAITSMIWQLKVHVYMTRVEEKAKKVGSCVKKVCRDLFEVVFVPSSSPKSKLISFLLLHQNIN